MILILVHLQAKSNFTQLIFNNVSVESHLISPFHFVHILFYLQIWIRVKTAFHFGAFCLIEKREKKKSVGRKSAINCLILMW